MSPCPSLTELRRRPPFSLDSLPLKGASREHLLHQISCQVEHAAAETALLTFLAFKLLTYLGVGYKWILRLAWLMLYAFLLMPGFLQAMWYYFLSGRVLRSIEYGNQPRNRLDLYMPIRSIGKQKSVVIFVTGGAWVIGYKAWGTLLGWALSDRDVIMASIDYRNFPQGTVSDMVTDVTAAIGWVVNNIAYYGGDPEKIFLVSQSAGAHLSSCALLHQAKREILLSKNPNLDWKVSDLRCFIGVSGGYDMAAVVDHFDDRGLYRSIFLSIMEGLESLPLFSPEVLVTSPSLSKALPLLPPFVLFHGTGDISMPWRASKSFAEVLEGVGAKVKLTLLPGKTHTDLIIQDLMRGGKDELFEAIMGEIHEGDEEGRRDDSRRPPRPRMLPELLIQSARFASPF